MLLVQRRLPADIFPTWKDVQDAVGMVKYLLFLTDQQPRFGKYNFEQKFTYWLLFLAIGIMGFSGLILWFPITFTRILPGGVIPAAKFAHSTEAIITALFVVLWHFYHVHVQRLNLSIFTGRLSEQEMKENHPVEYDRLEAELEREIE
jgi:cytochrome b subunit of formate dehydrogenase